ncbi:MAG: GNAT family N-acetyltransferase [Gammaproteobacteria bacterium]
MDHRSEDWKERVTTAEKAVRDIRSGDHVFVGTACAAPDTLVLALEGQERFLKDVQLIHFIADGIYPLSEDGEATSRFDHRIFWVGSSENRLLHQGKAHYIPVSLSDVPRLIRSGRIPIDVALIQTTPPEHGHVSLGISVDITKAAVENAAKVIAEINPNMPWTYGDSFIPVDEIDHFVEVDTPIKTWGHPNVDAVAEKIARYVASIIEDGSTLQIGLGRYPTGMLKYLEDRKDLGIHSDFVCEEIVDLIEKGIITGKEKTHFKGKIVASFCFGQTQRLYEFIDRDPMFDFQPIETVCDPENISRNHKMVSVTQAFTIDLRGQVCAGQYLGEELGGVSTQPEFIRGTAASPGGKPIICLASTTTQDGKRESAIRPLLREDEGVTIPSSDVHYVVTEYGVEYLYAKSVRERALSLIEIAHPEHRAELLEDAKRLGYVRADQVIESRAPYPVEEERRIELNNKKILIRPTKASDMALLQDLFYHLPPEDIVTRFFDRISAFSTLKADYLYNVDYDKTMAFIALHGEREDEVIVGNGVYAVDAATNLAEFAYMLRPEWQGVRLGGALKDRMIEYAKLKGVKGYYEIFLEDNEKMKRLAERGGKATITYAYGKGRAETVFERKWFGAHPDLQPL